MLFKNNPVEQLRQLVDVVAHVRQFVLQVLQTNVFKFKYNPGEQLEQIIEV